MQPSNIPLAVCALIKKDGKFLAVTRKGDPGMWSLPGGKVDPGEHLEEAVIREVFEETTLDVFIDKHLFTAVCTGEVESLTTGFLCSGFGYDNSIITEPGTYYDWLTEEELCSPFMSPFWEYNTLLFKKYAAC